MSLIAEFRLASPELVLHRTLTTVPEVSVEVEQEIGTDPDRPSLFFWASAADTGDGSKDPLAAFRDALRDDPSVTDATVLDSLPDRTLYRIQFDPDNTTVLYPRYIELGAVLLDLTGDADGWETKMRFPDRDALVEFREFCEDAGVSFDLERVYGGSASDADPVLTDRQRDAVRVAYSLGYFEVPREATLSDVADELGISTQAASERLRRGMENLASEAV